MSITLSAGSDTSNDIQISNLTDLQNNASTLFKLADSIVANLTQPVSSFPSSSSPTTLNYQSGNNSWTRRQLHVRLVRGCFRLGQRISACAEDADVYENISHNNRPGPGYGYKLGYNRDNHSAGRPVLCSCRARPDPGCQCRGQRANGLRGNPR